MLELAFPVSRLSSISVAPFPPFCLVGLFTKDGYPQKGFLSFPFSSVTWQLGARNKEKEVCQGLSFGWPRRGEHFHDTPPAQVPPSENGWDSLTEQHV